MSTKEKASQTWLVTARPEQRFHLANMLISDQLKIRGRKEDAKLWRAREALGLIGLTETMLQHGKVNAALLRSSTVHQFVVTSENAEFLLEQREKVELPAATSFVLRPLLEQLAAGEDAEGAEDAAPFDEAAELPQWNPNKLNPPPEEPPGADE